LGEIQENRDEDARISCETCFRDSTENKTTVSKNYLMNRK